MEGIYQVADSFVSLTPIAVNCIDAGQNAQYSYERLVRENYIQPGNVFINFLFEFFYIVSDFFAQYANLYYEDWFSFSYHFGDLTYRFVVV